MKRELWKSSFGFIWSVVGSAVGLGSIWRFPYIVGQNGGAAFVLIFCFFLIFVSLPILISEILIGRKSQKNPFGAYKLLGKSKKWAFFGCMTIVTGFIISSFYGVICGWTFGYLGKSLVGGLSHFQTIDESKEMFLRSVSSPFWSLSVHVGFMFLATFILYAGIQKGIEKANKVFVPLLILVLVVLVVKGLSMKGSTKGLSFLFSPDWKSITPGVIMMALGQAFFGLSVGQGTMITYGSYLSQSKNILKIVVPIALAIIFVSLLAGMAIFPVVFSVGAEPTDGVNLMFETLPMIFSQVAGGSVLAILFFLQIFLAGLTSQISAMEPVISYLMDEKRWSRYKASCLTGLGALFLGIPSSLSFSLFQGRFNFFDCISYVSINILVPLGGLSAVILVGWKWGMKSFFHQLEEGSGTFYQDYPFIFSYFRFSIRFFIPILIAIIFFYSIGFF